MKEWLHEDFMYIKETALSDRLEHVETLEKQFTEKAAINEPELLHEDEDMMAFKHLVIQKNGKNVVQDRSIYEDAHIFAPNLHSMGLMTHRDFNNYFINFINIILIIKVY